MARINRSIHPAILSVLAAAIFISPNTTRAEVIDTAAQEKTCKDIGFRPKTVAYADCVMELLSRQDSGAPTASPSANQSIASTPKRQSQLASRPEPVALTPHEQTCASYGFKRTTTAFSNCLLELDRAKAQAQYAQQLYQMQVQQYQQQVAAYNAQQEAIRKERDRRKWEAIGRLGAGMANSTSPSFLGALNEGLAAANGIPIARPAPVAPEPPTFQNYTIRLPSGNQVYCNYNSLSGYMSCR